MKQTKTQKVLKYIAKHPKAKGAEVSKATGVGVSYVYLIPTDRVCTPTMVVWSATLLCKP